MANTINDLYLKYVNKVGKTLESDRYFQYMFEMVQAGENELRQNNRVFHKVVDEKWLGVIEESLDAISSIIEKPRRFVTTNEEVVPVALARKISADSVRHLSMNTQFIASSEEGDIQPTKILNVSTEETYDLYENRFIYHLIQRLVTFIDKRTDIIFWQTGDETANTLSFQSKVDDAYEEITYKIEMTVKNLQSHAENDTDNLSVFMRIDRVRRLVMSLRNSSFCQIMSGCSKVRSPIQRTNLIMKDPQYRTCYKLWQFLESYDDVGYTIDIQDTAMEFDEEYLVQMYTNLITNYTVFKSLLSDKRYIESNPLQKKKKLVKPKFIKRIEEEYVDNYDLDDVEIRQVFLKEVTQAQLDAEAALAEEIEARKQAQKELADMDDQMFSLQQQISNLMLQQQEAEIRCADEASKKEEAQKLLQEKEEMTAALESEKTALQEQVVALQEQAAQIMKEAEEKAAQMLAEAKAESERILSEEVKKKEEALQQIQEAEEKMKSAMVEKENAVTEKHMAEAEASRYRQLLASKEADNDNFVLKTKEDAQKSIDAIQAQADKKVQEAQETIENIQAQADDKVKEAKQSADQEIQRITLSAREEIAKASEERNQALKEKEDMRTSMEDAIAKFQEQEQLAKEAMDAKVKAEERADANTISHMIINAINGKKQKKDE